MLQECLEIFEKMLEEKGDRLITDVYVPKEGTYRLIEISDGEFKIDTTLEIYYDKKNKELVNSKHNKFALISLLDYYSKLVDMNKPMDISKIIHSNNYFSFAVRKENFDNGKLTDEVIKNYYSLLKNPEKKYKNKKNSKKLYDDIQKELGVPDIELIDKIQEYILYGKAWKDIDLSKKGYIKIFFIFEDTEETKKFYEKENKRYLIPNIYNNNDFNEIFEDNVLGLSNNNMNMNGKKPYLENKTRKISIPNLISQKQAFLQNKMFDYFWAQASKGRNNIYINNDEPEMKFYDNIEEPEFLKSGYYLRIKKDKNEVSIEQADVISDYNNNLEKSFILEDFIEILEEKKGEKYKSYNKLWEIKKILDDTFFEGKLKYGFDSDIKDLTFSSNEIRQCFVLSKGQLMDWFWKGNKNYLYEILDIVTFRLIRNSIIKGFIVQAQHQLNMRWCLLKYLNEDREEGEKMGKVRNSLREHINLSSTEEWEFSSDDEYAYAVGQAVSYLWSLSKSSKKDESIINTFLDAKNSKVIRDKLLQMYKRYNYGIVHNKENRFGKMTAAIMEYEPESINSEMVMAGFITASLIYEKNKESEE